MLIVTPPGYVLTSDGHFVKGGPMNILLGPGMRMDSAGNITYDFPKFDDSAFPKFEVPIKINNS